MRGRSDGAADAAGGLTRHVPVLLAEVCDALHAAKGGVFVDGTFGAGGYTQALLGTSEVLKVDPEGRVILTDTVKAHAGIADAVTFVGLGHKFQMWEPERFRTHLEEARAKVRDLKKVLGSRPGGLVQNSPPGARER